MNELHLFAGAGGGILGGILLGHTCVCAVEIEEYPRKILLQRQRDGILPRFPIWDDVRTFDGNPWRSRVDIVSAGFPCDDISPAGKKAGIDGAESSLFVEVCRIVSEIQPHYVFLENSGNLVGRGLARVIGELTRLGYDSRWCRLGAGHIGADHERLRTWVVSYTNGGEQEMEWDISRGRRFVEQVERNMVGKAVDQPWILGRDHGSADRVDRLSSIGLMQFPAVVALAWQILANQNDK
jgi:DNA (cytosine-5)-methyltransferase 1